MHKRFLWTCIAFLSLQTTVLCQSGGPQKPILSTGVTGSMRSTGVDNPQYLLSFIPVQRVLLAAGQHPLRSEEIRSMLQGTPVTVEDLLRVELLRKEQQGYRLNYLLLTIHDQEVIFSHAAEFGASLAAAFEAHRQEFQSLITQYPDASLRSQLLFDLVAGVSLNWQGLDLTTELGYRAQPPRHADGTVYFVHSAEIGASTDLKGLYLDSEFAPAQYMTVATFGDGDSMPRLQGWPDVFDGIEHATDAWQNEPSVFGALQAEYTTYALLALNDAGAMLDAVSRGLHSGAELASHSDIPEERRLAALKLLVATGYLREKDQHYYIGVPLLTEQNKPMVDALVALSRTIMAAWLRDNYPRMEQQFGGLSPMRSGVPFPLAFSEVWHYTFGFATKDLAESGFYANPRAPGNRYVGYVPLVFTRTVLKTPGS